MQFLNEHQNYAKVLGIHFTTQNYKKSYKIFNSYKVQYNTQSYV